MAALETKTAAGARGSARILVVDDIEANRDLLVRRLRRDGYSDIASAVDGEQALAMLAERPFDLVLLDVMMPRCNGFEVLERMAADRTLREVPVVMLSAQSEIDSVVRCIELGAVDYLQKPFNAVLLRARIGATLEKKRLRDEAARHLSRLEQELEAGRKLQLAMVPRVFPAPTEQRPVEVHAMMEPAREVGGDFYDFFSDDQGRFCFVIGDVSGKGVASALVMARTKALARTITDMTTRDEGRAGPGEILERINRELCLDNDDMMFVTMFFGMLDCRSGELSFSNAGHDAPILLRRNGLEWLAAPRSVAVGVLPEAQYPTGRIVMEEGESLFAFTDGVTEAAGADRELFGCDRLAAIVSERSASSPKELIEAVADAVKDFIGEEPAADDLTALAFRRASLQGPA